MRTRERMPANIGVPSGRGHDAGGDGLNIAENLSKSAIPKSPRKGARRANIPREPTPNLPDAQVSAGHVEVVHPTRGASSGGGQSQCGNHSAHAAPNPIAGRRGLVTQKDRASEGIDQAGTDHQRPPVDPQTKKIRVRTPKTNEKARARDREFQRQSRGNPDYVVSKNETPDRIIAAIQSLHREHRAIQRQVGDMNRRIKAEERWFAVRRYRAEGIPLPAGKFPDVVAADKSMVIATRQRFFAIRDYTEDQRKACLKELLAQVKPLPIMGWAAGVKGLGISSVAAVIGEAGDLANYANPGKLWKRMGLAVIDGKSQGKRTNAEEAAKHGYSPARRSEMHVIGDCLVRAGGPYADLYRARKAVEMEREGITKMHAHKRALRYIEKRLLREMWQAWRGASETVTPISHVSPADELDGLCGSDAHNRFAIQDGGLANAESQQNPAPVQPSRAKRVRRASVNTPSVQPMPGAILETV